MTRQRRQGVAGSGRYVTGRSLWLFFVQGSGMGQGKLDEAEAEYREAIHLDPKSSQVYFVLGQYLIGHPNTEPNADRSLRLQEACLDIRKAKEMSPSREISIAIEDILSTSNGSCPP
jgi:hypothetical protein